MSILVHIAQNKKKCKKLDNFVCVHNCRSRCFFICSLLLFSSCSVVDIFCNVIVIVLSLSLSLSRPYPINNCLCRVIVIVDDSLIVRNNSLSFLCSKECFFFSL